MGTPHRVCRTFARLDFILVPLPAARITAKIGDLSDMYPRNSYRSSTRRPHPPRLGRQDSNLRSRDQNPVPCHLATPQYRPAQIIPERVFAVRNRKRNVEDFFAGKGVPAECRYTLLLGQAGGPDDPRTVFDVVDQKFGNPDTVEGWETFRFVVSKELVRKTSASAAWCGHGHTLSANPCPGDPSARARAGSGGSGPRPPRTPYRARTRPRAPPGRRDPRRLRHRRR